MCKKDPRKVFAKTFSCDSASGAGMKEFIDNYPDRYVEAGISEQNAISVSAGLAMVGFVPVLAAITPFITMRAYEQVRNDIGYANMNVKLVGSGAGLAYSTLGSSHEAIEDISVIRTIPNIIILAPGDGYEVAQALKLAINHTGPVYIRMPRHSLEDICNEVNRNLEIGKSETLREGDDVLVLTYGTMVDETKKAASILEKKGIYIGIEEFMTVKPIDVGNLIKLCKQYKVIVTVEEHSKTGGFGSYVAELLSSSKDMGMIHIIGIDEGSKKVGPYDEILDAYGLTGPNLATQIEEIYKTLK